MSRALLLSAGLCCGVDATDFKYYLSSTADWRASFAGGTELGWEAEHAGENDMVLFYPAMKRLTLEPGASWPPSGDAFYMASDVTWVVANGAASFGANASETHVNGDVFWTSAGTAQGPVANTGSGPLTLSMVSGGGRQALEPLALPAPDANPSTKDAVTRSRSYRNVTGEYRPNPSPHSKQCADSGGVWNKNFGGQDMSPPVLRVDFSEGCAIPWHYHPTGALYYITAGSMAFEGDIEGDSTVFQIGDVRWVRPGWTYGPERNAGTGQLAITVMGTDTPPEFLPDGQKPKGAYEVRKSVVINHVYQYSSVEHFEI